MAVRNGYEVIVANTGYSPERTEVCVQRMLERKVDGVAVMTSEMGSHLIERFHSRQIPMVFLDTGVPSNGISNILVDYTAGVDAAVEHVTSLGHTRIGFISGPMDLASARTRRQALLASLKRKGVRVRQVPDRGRQPPHRWRTCRHGTPARSAGATHRRHRVQ